MNNVAAKVLLFGAVHFLCVINEKQYSLSTALHIVSLGSYGSLEASVTELLWEKK